MENTLKEQPCEKRKLVVLNYFVTVDLDRRNDKNIPLVRYSPNYKFDFKHYDACKFHVTIIENGVEIPVACHILAPESIGVDNVRQGEYERKNDENDYFITKGVPSIPDWNDLTCVTVDLLNKKREKVKA